MKGVVMNLLADMVETQLGMHGMRSWMRQARMSTRPTALYEDERLLNMVGIISRRNCIPVSDLVFAFGQFMFPAFYDRYPSNANMLDFLEALIP